METGQRYGIAAVPKQSRHDAAAPSRRRLARSFAGLAMWCAGQAAMAAGYPDHPVHLIVPFAAGGFTDIAARVLSQELSNQLGQPFVVENRAGAGSTLGTEYVAKSAPDGYTLALISSNHVTSQFLYKNLSYDPLKSFTPIAKVADSPYVLLVNSKLPVDSVSDLVKLAKTRTLNLGSSGNGSTQHLMGGLFMSKAGITLRHVPYRGSAQAMQDLAAGFVETSFAAISNSLPNLQAGKIKALGVTSKQRSPYLPGVPSLEEAGIKGYDAVVWLALVGPAGMDPAVVDKLNRAVQAGLSKPESVKALATAGVDVRLSSPKELGDYMAQEEKQWGDVIRGINLKID